MGRTRSFQSPAPGPDARWSVQVASAKRRVPGQHLEVEAHLVGGDAGAVGPADHPLGVDGRAVGELLELHVAAGVLGAEDEPGPEEAGAAVAGLLGAGDRLAAGDVGAHAPRVVAATPPVAHLGALAAELDPAVDPPRLVVAAVVLVDPAPDPAEVLVLLVGVEGRGPLEVEGHAVVAAAVERQPQAAERLDHLGAQRADRGDLGGRVEQLGPQRAGDADVVLLPVPDHGGVAVDHVHVQVRAHARVDGEVGARRVVDGEPVAVEEPRIAGAGVVERRRQDVAQRVVERCEHEGPPSRREGPRLPQPAARRAGSRAA